MGQAVINSEMHYRIRDILLNPVYNIKSAVTEVSYAFFNWNQSKLKI